MARYSRRLLSFLFGPFGHTLFRSDGTRHNRIHPDGIPDGTIVVIEDGRHFVRTGETDEAGFEIYREGHKTHEYRSWD